MNVNPFLGFALPSGNGVLAIRIFFPHRQSGNSMKLGTNELILAVVID
jgi:hypothetical protein